MTWRVVAVITDDALERAGRRMDDDLRSQSIGAAAKAFPKASAMAIQRWDTERRFVVVAAELDRGDVGDLEECDLGLRAAPHSP